VNNPSAANTSRTKQDSPIHAHQVSVKKISTPKSSRRGVWKKYGQKVLKNSNGTTIRCYYRCSAPECPVRKQIDKGLEGDGQATSTCKTVGTHNHALNQNAIDELPEGCDAEWSSGDSAGDSPDEQADLAPVVAPAVTSELVPLRCIQDFADHTNPSMVPIKQLITLDVPIPATSDLSYPLKADIRSFCNLAECKAPDTAMELSSTQPQFVTEASYPFRILSVNSAWLDFCGYEKSEVVGMTPKILQGPKTEKDQLLSLVAFVALRKSVVVQLTNYTKQGQPFLNTLRVEPMSIGNQQLCLATSEMKNLAVPHQREKASAESMVCAALAGLKQLSETAVNVGGTTLQGNPESSIESDKAKTMPVQLAKRKKVEDPTTTFQGNPESSIESDKAKTMPVQLAKRKEVEDPTTSSGAEEVGDQDANPEPSAAGASARGKVAKRNQWKKYGQKIVKKRKSGDSGESVRCYYRCNFPGCPVKKQIEKIIGASGIVSEKIPHIWGNHNHPEDVFHNQSCYDDHENSSDFKVMLPRKSEKHWHEEQQYPSLCGSTKPAKWQQQPGWQVGQGEGGRFGQQQLFWQ